MTDPTAGPTSTRDAHSEVTNVDETNRPDEGPEEELPLPVGTLFFMMIFLMVMAGMWLGIYFDFLGR